MTIAAFLAKYEQRLGGTYYVNNERALMLLLRAHEDRLPELNDHFHGSFRRTSITGSAKIDMAIWYLLQNAPIFWDLYRTAVEEVV